MEDAFEDETKIVSVIQVRYQPFILEAINQVKKTGGEVKKLEILNALYEGLTQPLIKDKVAHFKKNKDLLERLYQKYEKVRELRQKRNSDKSPSRPTEALASSSKFAVGSSDAPEEKTVFPTESSSKDSKMDKAGEPSPLQNHMSCKMCAFVGQYLVKHYVEVHPGAEIPVCITPKELNTLKSNAETPVQQPVDTAVQEDRFEVVINFLNKLGQTSTFTNPITCPLCSFSSVLKAELVSHLIIHQTSNLKCYFCLVTETNLNDFRDHMSTHTGEYAYQCIHCKFRGASSSDVAHHISQNHPGREAKTIFENVFHPDGGCLKGYVCSTCGFIQMGKQSVEKHVSSVDLFCRGSYVIELDLSKGRKGASTATVVKGNYIPTAADSSEYIIPNSEAQAAGRNASNLDSGAHAKSIGQNRVYIQDEIEIAPPDPHADSILPFNDDNNQTPPLNIKTEKIDEGYNHHSLQSQARNSGNTPSYLSSNVNILPNPPIASHVGRPANESFATTIPDNQAEAAAKKTINFTCASCQFNTLDEAQFIKHARTDHRSDLSLWCKNCGKCFSNAGVLVSHIKESACIKEDMIYRCGVKECTFETPSGQTFVHHLRHCHKGSPFIFCVHCQKIFTLPHCLILHMQNDCPYKEKNRRTPGQTTSMNAPVPKPVETVAAVAKPDPSRSLSLPVQASPSVASHVQSETANKSKVVDPAGRGRGKVKSRGRGKPATDSSESDPDDPSWSPGEAPPARSLRRTSRTSRKSEASDSDQSPTSKGSSGGPFACTCCEFSTRSNALLEDHYLTVHKKPGKIGCLICNLKFESTQNFLDHFVLHKKESAGGKSNSSVAKNESSLKENLTKVKSEPVGKSKTTSVVQIPYQAAIHEKNQKDSKLKCFEELKSKEDLTKMKEPVKLKHFFKCMLYSCTFTTDNSSYFVSHLNDNHHGKQLHCPFCFEEYNNSTNLTTHMLQIHGKRCYQCSSCFYRAFSKPHVQVHIRNFHSKGKKADVFTCTTHINQMNPDIAMKAAKSDVDKTTWPFRCAIGLCKFETYEPNEFKKHNDITHRAVSVFICFYCKAEFISFKRLMNHYRLHGINNFQCTYCLHGSDTKEEIMSHLSLNHADFPIQIHVRAPQESPFSNKHGNKLQSDEQTTTDLTASATRLEDQRFQKKYGKNSKAPEMLVGEAPNLIPKSPVRNFKREPSILEKIYPDYIGSFEKKFTCGIPNCTKLFESVNFYLRHLKLIHTALNVICPYCFEAVERESDFKDHLLFHGPNLFACGSDVCCYNHWNREEVVKHTKTQHEKEPRIVNIREQNADTPSAVIPEIDNVDPKQNIDSKGGLTCPFCNYKTYNRVMMKKHIYIELEYVRFQCYYCKKKCSTRKELLSHFLSEHPNGSILSSVDVDAEIEYLVKTYIYCLQNMSSGETEIEGECKPNLNCSDCRKLFTRARDWHNHLSFCLMHHYVANVLNYVTCSYCNVTCSRASTLKMHSGIVHEGKQPRYTENPNRLEWMKEKLVAVRLQFLSFIIGLLIKNCSGLVLNDLLTWQKNYKLESKLYKCVYCTYSNNFRYNVERHLTSSHNDKPIKIERLSKSFFTSGPPLNILHEGDACMLDDSKISPVCRKGDVQQIKEIGCGICPCEFTCLDNLMQHAVLDHAFQVNDTFPYFYCPVSGSNLQNVEKTYCCTYCKSGDMVLPELKLHHDSLHVGLPFKAHGSLTIATNSSLTVKCGHCPETFATRTAFYKHCKNIHPKFPVKEFSEIASGSQKRKFGSIDDNSASPSSQESPHTPEHGAKKLKADADVYICLYCYNIFPSLEKIKAHFIVLHPCLPFTYQGMSVPLKDDVSVSFGVTEFLDSSTSDAPILVPEGKQKMVSKKKSPHSNASPFSESKRLNKITLHLSSKFRDRSLKFSVVHLSQKFSLFPVVNVPDIMKDKTSKNIFKAK